MSLAAAVDPQVTHWWAVNCGTPGCDSFDEGGPGSTVSAADALAVAVGPTWEMTRCQDGRLYCTDCTDQATVMAECEAADHPFGEWVEIREHRLGDWDWQVCLCGTRYEKHEVNR